MEHAKRIITGILVHVLASVIRIVRLVNTWNTCECTQSLVDDLVGTCDEIEDTPNRVVINLTNGINYWLFAVGLLETAYLLLLVVMAVK